jgi:protein arginine N-methyltransferase 1
MSWLTSALAHHHMLMDPARVLAYRAAIFAHARDRVVVDLGTGTGLLALFAAQAGARKVYAIERGAVGGLARLMARANGVADRIEVLTGDSRELTLPERAELVVHELFGGDGLCEGVLGILEDARQRHATPEARFLPRAVEVFASGCEPRDRPTLLERMEREATELGRLYGLDLSPYLIGLQAHSEVLSLDAALTESTPPTVLTAEVPLWRVEFASAGGALPPREVSLPVTSPGHLGAVALHFRAELDEQLSLSTSPYAPRTHWGWPTMRLSEVRAVRPGDRVPLRARLDHLGRDERVLVELATP